MSEVGNAIRKALQEVTKNALLGIENDLLVKPTAGMKPAEYYSYRSKKNEITIVDVLNKNIVIQIEIINKLQNLEIAEDRIGPIAVLIRAMGNNIYILSFTGKNYRLPNKDKHSLYWSGYNNTTMIEICNNRRSDRDRHYIPGWDSNNGVDIGCYDRLFLTLNDQGFKLAQFIVRGNLLIADVDLSENGEFKVTELDRICLDLRTDKVIKRSNWWPYGGFRDRNEVPNIVCTHDYILTDIHNLSVRETNSDNIRVLEVTCETCVYDYNWEKIHKGRCKLKGRRLGFVVFDYIDVNKDPIEVTFE
jgi:hypothetical protein